MTVRPGVKLEVRDLGSIGYQEALELQAATAAACLGGGDGVLYLLEHPPVVTCGRNSHDEHVLVPREELARRGVQLHECDRGGDVTYHGPGQLVGYPILLLPEGRRGVKEFVTDLEEVLIRTLTEFGIDGGRSDGYRGVWVGDDKVAALGVRIARWVTTHGFALNVTTDLSYYDLITPCGIRGRGVTSMARLLGQSPDMGQVKAAVARHLIAIFG